MERGIIHHNHCPPWDLRQQILCHYGQARTSNELRKQGIFVSGSGVRSIWLRHNLENFKKRLAALEAKVEKEGIILTEAQIIALEKK
ncbi:hypothetical protein XIS1_490001 [Xenorhabdus innexi]|uniref:Integrase n=1 Tax=Xenorhabdus innexi TaxID=290109 RepID=A0A1N6MZ00_9GAMM|nr:integrase [Xenorhabdus innexi]SIP74004.1 hypothetical protein XIS1_490001 [Xenorhabdus innexi]